MEEINDDPGGVATTHDPDSDKKLRFYASQMLNSMAALQEKGHFGDIILKSEVSQEEFLAHKVVLGASSPFIHNLLLGIQTSDLTAVCVLPVSSICVKALLKYIYTGHAVLTDHSTLSELHVVAQEWQMEDLGNMCKSVLEKVDKYYGPTSKSGSEEDAKPSTTVLTNHVGIHGEALSAEYVETNQLPDQGEDLRPEAESILADPENQGYLEDSELEDFSGASDSTDLEYEINKNDLPRISSSQTGRKPRGKRKGCKRKSRRHTECPPSVVVVKVEKPFICRLCKEDFVDVDSVKEHLESEHNMLDNAHQQQCYRSVAKMPKVGQLQRFVCTHPGCEYSSFNLRHVVFHCCNVHGIPIPEYLNYESFRCEECGKTLDNKQGYDIHMLGHKKLSPYLCDICGRGFRSSYLLKRHKHTQHEGKKLKIPCPRCEYVAVSANNLAIHMRKHSNERPFACVHCSKAFKAKNHLARHLELIHDPTKAKPPKMPPNKDGLFPCPHCKFITKKRYRLVTHLRKHTGEKPFMCHLCPYAYRSMEGLTKHLRVKHPKRPLGSESITIQGTAFVCPVCSTMTGTMDDLRLHLKSQHELHEQDEVFLGAVQELASVQEFPPIQEEESSAYTIMDIIA